LSENAAIRLFAFNVFGYFLISKSGHSYYLTLVEDCSQIISFRLYGNIPRENVDVDVIKATAIRWASTHEYPNGHPRLHQLLAHNLWSLKRYPESRNNFLFSCDGSGCGKMLVEFHTNHGFPRELDLFITSAVLQFLVLRKHIVAAWALKVYTESHPSIKR